MTQVQIKRFECSDRGTVGVLLVNDSFVCMTLERPWKLNTRNISCVPTGIYTAGAFRSNRHGATFKVLDVPDRSGVLFHKGNEIIHSTGCILLGQEVRPKVDRLSLINSTIGFMRFITALGSTEHFTLRIELV